MKNIVIILCILFFAKNESYASARDPGHSKEWLKALHYDLGGGGFLSRVDNDEFFLSELGRNDPHTELKAFVDTFEKDAQMACRFPYRYRVLRQLNYVRAKSVKCEKLDFFKEELGLDEVSLVFAAQYADNPSSILGHLFLQFHNTKRQVKGEELIYLNKTINYAAGVPPDVNILSYILRGIFGGFRGQYAIYQFAEMIEKYAHMESRDIYVYRLALTREQNEALAEHIWELINYARPDYYFFDENCAFQVLAAVDAVLPGDSLLPKLPPYVAPLEVLKLVGESRLVAKVDYFPSLYQKHMDKYLAMSATEKGFYTALAQGELEPHRVPSALVLDAALDRLNLKKHSLNGQVDDAWTKERTQLLSARARLGQIDSKLQETEKVSPHLSHGAKQISFYAASFGGSKAFRFGFRPGVHDLINNGFGYQRNSEVSFLNLDLDLGDEIALVREAKILSVATYLPSLVETRATWHVEVKFFNESDRCWNCLTPDLSMAMGWAHGLVTNRWDLFLLGKLSYLPYVIHRSFGFGGGYSVGSNWTPRSWLRVHLVAEQLFNAQFVKLNRQSLRGGLDLSKGLELHASIVRRSLRGLIHNSLAFGVVHHW